MLVHVVTLEEVCDSLDIRHEDGGNDSGIALNSAFGSRRLLQKRQVKYTMAFNIHKLGTDTKFVFAKV